MANEAQQIQQLINSKAKSAVVRIKSQDLYEQYNDVPWNIAIMYNFMSFVRADVVGAGLD